MTRTRQPALVAAALIAAAAVIVVAVSAGFFAAQAVGSSPDPAGAMTIDLYAARTDLADTAEDDVNVAWDLYALDDSGDAPEGDPIGRMLAHCTPITSSEGVCRGFINLDQRGTFGVYKASLGTGFTATAVIPGTGEFVGSSGTFEVSVARGHPNDRVYHVALTRASGS